MSATIHDFDHPDDNIETRTGLLGIDIDPKVVARRMRRKTWEDRALFLDNVLGGTIEIWVIMDKHVVGARHAERHFKNALTGTADLRAQPLANIRSFALECSPPNELFS